MMTKKIKQKEPVRLRFKKLANGNASIYLDMYREGVRSYEFLKLYIVPVRNESDKLRNEETLRTANAVKAQRIIALQNNEHGFRSSGQGGKVKFIDYMRTLSRERQEAGKTAYARILDAAIEQLLAFKGDQIQIRQVDKDYMLGFIRHLKEAKCTRRIKNPLWSPDAKKRVPKRITVQQPLSQATQAAYFNMVSIALNRAVRQEMIAENPARRIETFQKPKQGDATKNYLTLHEVRKLAAADCAAPEVKQAFLFSCFAPLRLCDIRKLTWSKVVRTQNESVQVEARQTKTGVPVYIPLSANALKFLPDRGASLPDEKVFRLPSVNRIENHLQKWAEDAGIDKHLTFHVSRHTFGTLGIASGAPIEVISQLLGHRKISTTQIYTKIISESKMKAVNLIPEI